MSTLNQIASLPQLEATRLYEGYIQHFAEQDRQLTYLHSERKLTMQLIEDVWLVGTLDAEGVRPDGKPFFRDDKTSNPRYRGKWQSDWAMSPQALTYGLLSGEQEPRFLVRKAFKSNPATYEHEWFKFGKGELEWWENQLVLMTMEIRRARAYGYPWPMNTKHGCFAYGKNYPCPFYSDCCTKLDFEKVPTGVLRGDAHMDEYKKILPPLGPDAVVLHSGSIENWMRCRERYRRFAEDGLSEMENEAIAIGREFHLKLETYTNELIKRREN